MTDRRDTERAAAPTWLDPMIREALALGPTSRDHQTVHMLYTEDGEPARLSKGGLCWFRRESMAMAALGNLERDTGRRGFYKTMTEASAVRMQRGVLELEHEPFELTREVELDLTPLEVTPAFELAADLRKTAEFCLDQAQNYSTERNRRQWRRAAQKILGAIARFEAANEREAAL